MAPDPLGESAHQQVEPLLATETAYAEHRPAMVMPGLPGPGTLRTRDRIRNHDDAGRDLLRKPLGRTPGLHDDSVSARVESFTKPLPDAGSRAEFRIGTLRDDHRNHTPGGEQHKCVDAGQEAHDHVRSRFAEGSAQRPHARDVGCDRFEDACRWTTHAERRERDLRIEGKVRRLPTVT